MVCMNFITVKKLALRVFGFFFFNGGNVAHHTSPFLRHLDSCVYQISETHWDYTSVSSEQSDDSETSML